VLRLVILLLIAFALAMTVAGLMADSTGAAEKAVLLGLAALMVVGAMAVRRRLT